MRIVVAKNNLGALTGYNIIIPYYDLKNSILFPSRDICVKHFSPLKNRSVKYNIFTT